MRVRLIKRIVSLLVACLFVLPFVACSGEQTAAKDESLSAVVSKGELVIGVDVEFPPMSFYGDGGELVGFDVDAAREAAKRLGVEARFYPIDWDEKENELNAGNIDCIWSGMSFTPARDESMNLSAPYMNNELIVVVPGDSAAKVLADLKGKKIGVQSGTTGEEALEGLDIYPEVTPVVCDNVMIVFDKLKSGEVDAAFVDSVLAFYYVFSQEESYYILADSLSEEEYVIGFRKGDKALRDEVQKIISDMKADGALGKISKKWFGSDITTVK